MRVTFQDTEQDAVMVTTDWVMPPRVGDHVFLIGEARYDFANKEPRGYQFDAVVLSVLFFGPDYALVTVRQKQMTAKKHKGVHK